MVEVVNAHQGDPKQKEKLAEAEKLVHMANCALDELSQRLEEEKQALAYRKVAEQNARRAEAGMCTLHTLARMHDNLHH